MNKEKIFEIGCLINDLGIRIDEAKNLILQGYEVYADRKLQGAQTIHQELRVKIKSLLEGNDDQLANEDNEDSI